MDGVLAHFTERCVEVCNDACTDTNLHKTIDDIIHSNSWNLHQHWNLTHDEWALLIKNELNFWSSLRPMPWANQLYKYLHQYCDEMYICTKPLANDKNCPSQKIAWCVKNLNAPEENIILTHHKELLAKPHTLLIDDNSKFCNAFRANGGQAVCVPSDWNTQNLTFDMVWKSIETVL